MVYHCGVGGPREEVGRIGEGWVELVGPKERLVCLQGAEGVVHLGGGGWES